MTAARAAAPPRIRTPVWLVARAVAPVMFATVWRMRRTGVAHVPPAGPVLFVSNHVSNADPPLLAAAVLPRRLHYMAKSELFRNPALAWLIRALGAFPVNRGAADREAFRTAKEILAEGHALLMFPEGTRSRDGRLGTPWPGAGSLALEPGVTVVPLAIWGSQWRFGPVRVAVGAPVDLSDVTGGSRGARAQRAAERMMEEVARLLPSVGGPADALGRA